VDENLSIDFQTWIRYSKDEKLEYKAIKTK